MKYYKRIYIAICLALCLSGCFSNSRFIQNIASRNESKYRQALSGDGRILAYLIEEDENKRIKVKDLRTGRLLRLRHLSRYQDPSSTSLSWHGRYIAIITQIGGRRLAVIEDLIGGKFYRIPYYADANPISLSLSPEAKMLTIQFKSNQRSFLEFFDLTNTLKPDLLSGSSSINYSQ